MMLISAPIVTFGTNASLLIINLHRRPRSQEYSYTITDFGIFNKQICINKSYRFSVVIISQM